MWPNSGKGWQGSRTRRSGLEASAVLLAALLILGATAAAGGAQVQTTTTTYQYDADGAPTAVTTQVDGGTPSTIYLTWDDFVPNAANPTTGTVLAGNGNLVGFGPAPGGSYTTQFQYDPRNRLTNAAPSGAQSVAYTYYPASLMATSTLASSDALQFYYGGGAAPKMTNINQPSTGTWSTYLGDMTYLSDGSEQMRCRPRKDVAGIYEPAQQSFTPETYDPYGATTSGGAAAGQTTYDMHQNPFQYAGEYQDAAWPGYYLRNRWYLPPYQAFLERDPGDGLHRYSYAGGDPIGHTDPTGLHYDYGDFSRSVNRFLRPVNKGLRGELLPLIPVYGQIVGGIQLLGNIPEVWHHPNFKTWASFSFLVVSMASEVQAELPVFDSAYGPAAFRGRLGVDLYTGIGQAALASSGPHGKLDTHALWQSISYTASGMFWGRAAAGFGYRPYDLNDNDVDAMMQQHFQNFKNADQGLVFRVRYKPNVLAFTSPIQEALGWGNYHEAVFGATRDRLWLADVNYGRDDTDYVWRTRWSNAPGDLQTPSNFLAGKSDITRQYILAGKFRADAIDEGFRSQLDISEQNQVGANQTGRTSSPFADYNKAFNNCQQNAATMRRTIAQFNRLPPPEIINSAD